MFVSRLVYILVSEAKTVSVAQLSLAWLYYKAAKLGVSVSIYTGHLHIIYWSLASYTGHCGSPSLARLYYKAAKLGVSVFFFLFFLITLDACRR